MFSPKRPPETWSAVAAIFATITGWASGTCIVANAWMRSVAAMTPVRPRERLERAVPEVRGAAVAAPPRDRHDGVQPEPVGPPREAHVLVPSALDVAVDVRERHAARKVDPEDAELEGVLLVQDRCPELIHQMIATIWRWLRLYPGPLSAAWYVRGRISIFSIGGQRMAETTTDSFLTSSRISLGEAIARELEQEITGGELIPGQRLGTKEELRGRFGVALATINEAIRLLEMRGMLTARPGPGGGVFVTHASTRARLNHFVMGYKWNEAAIADHHTVRNALEPLVCREAAQYRRDSDIRVL